jgi:hypothetical protein
MFASGHLEAIAECLASPRIGHGIIPEAASRMGIYMETIPDWRKMQQTPCGTSGMRDKSVDVSRLRI